MDKPDPKHDWGTLDSLSDLDLDVELLEERIEMSTLLHPLDCVCVGNVGCVNHAKAQ